MTAKTKECRVQKVLSVWKGKSKTRNYIVFFPEKVKQDNIVFFQVREWREFEHLTELPCLEVFSFVKLICNFFSTHLCFAANHRFQDLVFIGNPLEEESTITGNYTQQVSEHRKTFLSWRSIYLGV